MITNEQIEKILTNPYYAINFHKDLFGNHEPMVSKDEWVKAALVSIEEEGAEKFLYRLLDVLEGNFPRGEE